MFTHLVSSALVLSLSCATSVDATAQQTQPIGPEPRKEQPIEERSIEEVKAVFSQHSARIYGAYRRALQRKPNLAGKAAYVLEVTPAGDALNPELAWSNLNDHELEREIASIILSMKFGKKGTRNMIVSFPVEFQPN